MVVDCEKKKWAESIIFWLRKRSWEEGENGKIPSLSSTYKLNISQSSLVVQWLRLQLPVQGAGVQSLVGKHTVWHSPIKVTQ